MTIVQSYSQAIMTLYRIQKADQQEYGPFTQGELCQLILQGQVFSRTLTQVEGTQGWKQLSDFAEFSEPLAAAAKGSAEAASTPLMLPIAPEEAPPLTPESSARDWATTSVKLGGAALAVLLAAIAAFHIAVNLDHSGNMLWAGIVLVGVVLTPLLGMAAMMSAVRALYRNHQRPAELTGRDRALLGFISGGMPLLLLAIAVPNFVKARTTPSKGACVANLKQIDGAIQQWALENKKAGADAVTTTDIKDYLKGSQMPQCPAGGSYTVKDVQTTPTCSIGGALHTL